MKSLIEKIKSLDFKVLGTISHAVIAVLLVSINTPLWIVVGLLFAARERSEQKYKIDGSVKTLKKQWLMTKALFSKNVWYQWAAPTVAALAVSAILGHRLI